MFFDHSQNNECRSLQQRNELPVEWSKFRWRVGACARPVRPTSSLVARPRVASSSAAWSLFFFPSDCPLALSLPFPSSLCSLCLRCRDPSARWCITKDTCSGDVARQIVCVCVFGCEHAFIHSSVFRLRLGADLIKIVLKLICPFLPQIMHNGLFNSVPCNKPEQCPSQGLALTAVPDSARVVTAVKTLGWVGPSLIISFL